MNDLPAPVQNLVQNLAQNLAAPYALGFAGGGLQRRAERRAGAEALAAGPEAQVLPVWRGRPLLTGPAEAPHLAWLPAAAALPEAGTRVYLGESNDSAARPLFATDISRWSPPEGDATDLGADRGPGRTGADIPAPAALRDHAADARFTDLRALITALTPFDAEVAATAKGVLDWHASHRFCAACGTASAPENGGWQRRCPSCARPHFPRTDPVVVMLVTRGNRLLIGRSPGWPEGFYSLLAGFMEPGETVAAAVRREVAEETAVETGTVRLLDSQPWPFPASLMLGCQVEATSEAITCDPAELDDALWVSREELLAIYAGTHGSITAPRNGAIAGHLMHRWLADRLD